MSTATPPVLKIKLRAVRAVPALHLAAGEVLDLHITPVDFAGIAWGEMSAQLQSGALEDLSPGSITAAGLGRFVDAVAGGSV